jgi:phosphoserine phosphatase RsbU/P
MSRFNQSLARRMTTLILIGTGLVLSLVLGSSYILQRQWILPAAMQQDAILSQSVLYRIDEQLAGPRAVANQTALLLGSEFYRWSRDEIPALIHKTLAANPGIEGMALALAPEVAGRKNFEIVYGWRDGQSISVHERLTPEQDYQHDWFYLPYHLKTPQWIDPYYDPDAQALMVTYSVPVLIYGKVVAVITCDLSLEKIRQMLDELPLGDGGIAVLLSRWGTFISHPNRDLEMKETIFSLADSQKNPEQRALLRELGQRMVNGEIGHMEYQRPNEGDVAFIHYASIPSVDWSLGIIRSKSQVLAPLFRLNRLSAVIGFAGIVLLLIPAIAIAVSVARPLRRLADTAGQLAVGDFEAPLPKMRSRDEVFQLTESFAPYAQRSASLY